MVVWCPDWPVVAAAAELGLAVTDPVAVIESGEVFACSEEARRDGVDSDRVLDDVLERVPMPRIELAQERPFYGA